MDRARQTPHSPCPAPEPRLPAQPRPVKPSRHRRPLRVRERGGKKGSCLVFGFVWLGFVCLFFFFPKRGSFLALCWPGRGQVRRVGPHTEELPLPAAEPRGLVSLPCPPPLSHPPFCASVPRSISSSSSGGRKRLGRSSEAARRVPAGSGRPGLTMPRGVAGGPRASRAAGRPRRAASEPCAPASPPVPRGRPTASGGAAGPPRFLPPLRPARPAPGAAEPRAAAAPARPRRAWGPLCSPPRAAPSRAACAGLTAPDRVLGSQPLNCRCVPPPPFSASWLRVFLF